MSDWETARKCPRCDQPGKETTNQMSAPSGDGKIIELKCQNLQCDEKHMPWYVQVRSDGTIPEPTIHTKENVVLHQSLSNPGLAQQIRDALQMQNEMTMRPGGAEIGH